MIENTKKKVSICCQTYNHKDYIAQAINSFLMQKTNFSFEILLRDDASNDGTQDIVKEYSVKYPELINPLIYSENQYQKGIRPFRDNVKRAKGKYIALCEGDDYWTDPLKLQKQVDFLEANRDCMISYHNCLKVSQENIQFGLVYEKNPGIITFAEALNGAYTKTCTVVFRMLPEFNFDNVIDDLTLCLELLKNGGYAAYMNETMSVYRHHPGGIWSQKNELDRFHLSLITEMKIEQMYRNSHKDVVNKRLNKFYKNSAKRLLKNNYLKVSLIALFKSLKYEKSCLTLLLTLKMYIFNLIYHLLIYFKLLELESKK